MSNLPPNPYNSAITSQINANTGPQPLGNNPQLSNVPLSQLPPGYRQKQDANSNSPSHASTTLNNVVGQMLNNYNQSGNNSPAFNAPGMSHQMQQPIQSSPIKPPLIPGQNQNPYMTPNSISPRPTVNANPSPISHANFPQKINDNSTPLIPSSQYNQPLINGPPVLNNPQFVSQPSNNQYPHTALSPTFGSSVASTVPISSYNPNPSLNSGPQNQPRVPFSGPPRHSPSLSAQPLSTTVSGPPIAGPPLNGPPNPQPPMSRPLFPGPPVSNQPHSLASISAPPISQPHLNHPSMSVPPNSMPPFQNFSNSTLPQTASSTSNLPISNTQFSRPPTNTPMTGPPMTNPSALGEIPHGVPSIPGPPLHSIHPTVTSLSGPPIGPPKIPSSTGLGQPGTYPRTSLSAPLSANIGATNGQPVSNISGHPLPPRNINGPESLPMQQRTLGGNLPSMPPMASVNGPPGQYNNIQTGPGSIPVPGQMPPKNGSGNIGQPGLPPQSGYTGQHGIPPMNLPPIGSSFPDAKNNLQNRYPQMGQTNQATAGKQYPQQYNTQNLTQQMGQMSVTKQGYDQLWGHHMVDLMAHRHILPEYPEDPPEIKLGHPFTESSNCSADIFRCTINRIPESNSLLQKSRLPLGILIHPFKDLNHLPVIQCATIVRCRSCRTYINPFVYFVDVKRWKCNLCYRVNDLPEEFQYDPVSKSYGDPTRRPEIKSATIEFIAPGEYMLRPPQPAVYLFLMDISQIARDSGYLQIMCDTLKDNLDQLPGDARTQVGFICYDSHIHYYLMSDGLTRPKEMTVIDIDEVFLPSPESLLVNLGERWELVRELLTVLPSRHSTPGVPGSALGAALQAAYKLMAPTGGRITVFQTCLPNVGPGALQSREDPNARSGKDVAHLNPATDFYKRLALDCSGAQVSVDLFLLSSQYSDLATLSGVSKFSAGTVYHMPLFRAARQWQADQFARMFTRYLTRKIGFEAVMRVRCTRGISIHTFHGNFFVRSTDLLSLPNVSPDAGFGMQLSIDETLSDLQQVCFQAALLYTSSKGERRIRVHTLALPIASNLTDVLHAADQQCIIGLLSKMAVDRCQSASLPEAREALINVAIDALSAFKLSQNLPAGPVSPSLHAPVSLRLLPLYLLALIKRKAFRTGTSTRLDDRVADMCDMKSLPLQQLMRAVYPELYSITDLAATVPPDEDEPAPDPPRMHLTAERISMNGAYLLDDGETIIIYVCHGVSPAFLSETFGVTAFSQIPDESRTLPRIDSEGNSLLHAFVDKLNDERPYASNLLVLRDNSPSRNLFIEKLVDDRVESAFAYYEFLQHVKNQVK